MKLVPNLLAAALLLAGLPDARAQDSLPPPLREVGFDQRLGARVPADLTLRDEAGRAVRLGDLLRGRPVLLELGYHGCPMLCGLVQDGLVRGLRPLSLDAGRDFDVICVSIDPDEGPREASAARARLLQRYGRGAAGGGWRCLTGVDASVRALAGAVGFRYAPDEERGGYVHAAGVVVLTPDGQVSRYLLGVDFAPRDLRLGLVEASRGEVGDPVDAVMLYCFQWDPARGRYGLVVMNVLRLGGGLTVVVLAGAMFVWSRRGRRVARGDPGAAR